MVPYASFPYADHVLRLLTVEPNQKIEIGSDSQIDTLISAALKLKELVAGMESLDDIKGYLIYHDEEAKLQKEESLVVASDIVKKYADKMV